MIRDKKKMGTMLDEIDEEILARNEAEDQLNEHNSETLETETKEEVTKNEEDASGEIEDTGLDHRPI
ncbi:hypothetical protein [Zobellia laminariae]|uniref:hypothetical protein n=1 Tax=Zobellia laminariae TaxID=248906 RepID=UPI0026F47012|nr:hypothetical protein [Zobellia laminariae]WKX78480.1 hypothetical protein Q5W13_11725 [Zobellia laminariae]